MLSAIGCLGIMLGTFGGLWAWEEQQCAKRNYLQEMYQMFRKGKYALVGQQMRCIEFFQEYPSEREEIEASCKQIARKLINHEVASGELAWKKVWEEGMQPYHFSREEREVVLLSGAAFFGKNLKETEELFDIYQMQYERLVMQSRQLHKEQRKVVLPVGMLSGIMLIILLI